MPRAGQASTQIWANAQAGFQPPPNQNRFSSTGQTTTPASKNATLSEYGDLFDENSYVGMFIAGNPDAFMEYVMPNEEMAKNWSSYFEYRKGPFYIYLSSSREMILAGMKYFLDRRKEGDTGGDIDLCMGILAFPFKSIGLSTDEIFGPIRFYDRSDVINNVINSLLFGKVDCLSHHYDRCVRGVLALRMQPETLIEEFRAALTARKLL